MSTLSALSLVNDKQQHRVTSPGTPFRQLEEPSGYVRDGVNPRALTGLLKTITSLICPSGDSCHGSLPYLFQGANTALEDGAVSGDLLGKARFFWVK